MNEEIVLKYIGSGAILPGVPARDLTKEEVREHGGIAELVRTGLYERVATKEQADEPKKDGK